MIALQSIKEEQKRLISKHEREVKGGEGIWLGLTSNI
jgi:hypothetical protein